MTNADLDTLTSAITADIAHQASGDADAFLIEMLALRENIARARHWGYTQSLAALRAAAMCRAEQFVDPAYAHEQHEQVAADQARIPAWLSALTVDSACGF
jgi:hypothetical protein